MEHKAVAYDALLFVRPGYLHRQLGFLLGSVSCIAWVAPGFVLFWRQDRRAGRELTRGNSLSASRFLWRATGRLLRYLQPGFHPSKVQDQHLIAAYLGSLELAG